MRKTAHTERLLQYREIENIRKRIGYNMAIEKAVFGISKININILLLSYSKQVCGRGR